MRAGGWVSITARTGEVMLEDAPQHQLHVNLPGPEPEPEPEPEAAVSTSALEPAAGGARRRGVGVRYRVVNKTIVRAGLELDSALCGKLRVGEAFVGLEEGSTAARHRPPLHNIIKQ